MFIRQGQLGPTTQQSYADQFCMHDEGIAAKTSGYTATNVCVETKSKVVGRLVIACGPSWHILHHRA